MESLLEVVRAGTANWSDYSLAAVSIGFLVGAVLAMFLLINWMKSV